MFLIDRAQRVGKKREEIIVKFCSFRDIYTDILLYIKQERNEKIHKITKTL